MICPLPNKPARTGFASFAVLLALLLAGCGLNQDPERLMIGGPFEFTSQDPARNGYVYTRMQVLETLLEVDREGRLLPGLAAEWRVDEDGLAWHFRLREGVRFHDRRQMTAAAVVNSLEMSRLKPGVIRLAPIVSIDETGPFSIAIRLSEPYSPLGAIVAHYTTGIVSPASFADGGPGIQWLFATGPYQVREYDPPHRIGVVRFEQYWGEPAIIPKAVYLTGHRAESRALQVMAGQTDIIYTLDPASLDLLRRRDDVQVHSDTIPRTIQIKLNSSHRFLADRDAREAISLALDRTGISNSIIRVPGSEANQLVPPSLADWHEPSLPPMKEDLDRARRLLAGLGWTPGPDGVLRRGGERFRLQMVTYADRPELYVVGTAIQAQLRRVGIDVGVSIVNSSGIPAGHVDGTLEMALVARNYGNISDPLGLFLTDYGDKGNGEWGAMGWHSELLPRLLQELKAESDPQRYREKARRVSTLMAEELPVIPVIFYTQQTAVSGRVQGFTFDPYERNYRISRMSFRQP
jgi:peptide/nickel transport system substrate-binding protein